MAERRKSFGAEPAPSGARKDSLSVPTGGGTGRRRSSNLNKELLDTHEKSFQNLNQLPEVLHKIDRISSWVSTVGTAGDLPPVEDVDQQSGSTSPGVIASSAPRDQRDVKQSPALPPHPAEYGERHNQNDEDADILSLSSEEHDLDVVRSRSGISINEFTEAEHMPTVVVVDEEEESLPKVMVAGEAVLQASGSDQKLAKVQSMMSCDSRGNMFNPVVMSQGGRYVSANQGNSAFRKISLFEAQQIHTIQGGSVGTASQTSLSTLRLGRQKKRNTVLMKIIQTKKEQHQHEDSVEGNYLHADDQTASRDTFTSGRTSTGTATQDDSSGVTPVAEEEQAEETKKAVGSIGIGTITQLRKWRVTARDKYGFNNPKTFAKSDMHLKYLSQHNTDVASDVPVPLKIQIHEELLPVIQSTHADYARNLGTTHQLTLETEERMAEMRLTLKMYNSDAVDDEDE